MTIAFYTVGDTTIVEDCPGITRSIVARTYARLRANRCYGVDTVVQATSVLNVLPSNSVNKVLFVGHGMPSGYFFSGSPDPARDFVAQSQNIFESNDTGLMDQLIRVLTQNGTESIEFHACNVGGGSLLDALRRRISDARSGRPVNLMAFSGTYQIQPQITNCRITGFSPPSLTVYPAGRLPPARP